MWPQPLGGARVVLNAQTHSSFHVPACPLDSGFRRLGAAAMMHSGSCNRTDPDPRQWGTPSRLHEEINTGMCGMGA